MLFNVLQDIQSKSLTFKYINKGKFFMCTCPFHKNMEERNPSCIINSSDSRFSPGFFHCLTCGESGGFKKLLQQINRYESILSDSDIERLGRLGGLGDLNKVDINCYLDKKIISNLSTDTNYLIEDQYNSLPRLQENILVKNSWRNIPLNIVQIYGGKLKDLENLIFPVYSLTGSFIGSVTARIKPVSQEEKKQGASNYIFSPGPWVSNALFNISVLDDLKETNTKDNNLYIVEGPRDTMNLTKLGYYSLAILGCKNFGQDIPNELLFLKRKYKFKKIIIMMDGDQAGYEGNKMIYGKMVKSKNFSQEEVEVKELPSGIDPAMIDRID